MAKSSKAKPKTSSLPVATDMPMRSYKPTAEDKARERRYQAEDDLRTMQRVAELKSNKDRVKAMKELATEQLNAAKKC